MTGDARWFLTVFGVKYGDDDGDGWLVDAIDVAVVVTFGTVELGLLRGADEDEEDNPRRARSILKLDNRDKGGCGEELVRLLDWGIGLL